MTFTSANLVRDEYMPDPDVLHAKRSVRGAPVHRTFSRMTTPTRLAIACVALLAGTLPAQTRTPYDTTLFRAMQWRNIGPFRGGRAVTAAGVTGQPLVYYAGYTGGGVWKTENAGAIRGSHLRRTWRRRRSARSARSRWPSRTRTWCMSGTGEHAVRGQSSSYGDGVYKSTDAGKTWTHIGLETTQADRAGARASDESRHRVRRGAGRSVEGHGGSRHLSQRPMAGRRGRSFSTA